jgi:uncharacterized protein (DUF1697 family)
VHVALLRGVNVGGKNRLPMDDLVEMFRGAGGRDAQSYIQSGNVVFRAEPARAGRIGAAVAKAIASRFRFDAPVVIRTLSELEEVARRNPFVKRGAETKTLHVAFLLDRPSPPRVAALDPDRSPPDEFVVRGREIYLRCPGGIGRSKLTTQYFDSALETTCTVRNWNTVLALVERGRGG